MANVYVVEQPNTTSIAYIAVPYGIPGGGMAGEAFSGVSVFADVELGIASMTLKRFQLITDVSVEQLVGILRWGYYEIFDGGNVFIEKDRIFIRSQAVVVDYDDLPSDKQFVVRARWFYPNRNWTAVFS